MSGFKRGQTRRFITFFDDCLTFEPSPRVGLPFAIVDCLLSTSAGVLTGLARRAALAQALVVARELLASARLSAREARRLARQIARAKLRALILAGDPIAVAARSARLAASRAARDPVAVSARQLATETARACRTALESARRVAGEIRASARRPARIVRSWFSARRAELIAIVARGGYYAWGGGYRPIARALC
jgi:hypothetical protein